MSGVRASSIRIESTSSTMDQPDGEAEPAVDRAHPLGVAGRQVVVDRHQVDALAGQGVEVDGERGDEGLALTGLHLGHPTQVEGHPAHELHVEVALADHPAGRLPGHGEALGEQVVEALAVVVALPELGGLGPEGIVGQRLDLGLESVDVGDDVGHEPPPLAFAGPEDLVEHAHTEQQAYRRRVSSPPGPEFRDLRATEPVTFRENSNDRTGSDGRAPEALNGSSAARRACSSVRQTAASAGHSPAAGRETRDTAATVIDASFWSGCGRM